MDYSRYGPDILVEQRDGVAVVTFNRPDKLNAMTAAMHADTGRIWLDFAADPDVRSVLITGAGRAFSVGGDYDLLQASVGDHATAARLLEETRAIAYNMTNLEKPIVSAINGYALGGGLAVAIMADVSIAAEDARFSAMFAKRALTPDSGVSLLLPSAVRYPKAAEMLLTSRFVHAREALKIGLVNRVVPNDDLEGAAYDMARLITESAPVAVRLSKRALRRPLDREAAAAFEYESYGGLVTAKTEDRAEGRHAFLDKRPPRWTGR